MKITKKEKQSILRTLESILKKHNSKLTHAQRKALHTAIFLIDNSVSKSKIVKILIKIGTALAGLIKPQDIF